MAATVEGDDDVIRALAGLAGDVATLDAWHVIAHEGEIVGSRLAPHGRGTLAAGVTGVVSYAGATITVRGRAAVYAGPINYGWRRRHIVPSLFLQRTSTALEDRATALLEDDVDKQLTKRGLT